MSRQSGGWMPTYARATGHRPCMVGYHSSAIFLDAYRKRLKNFDIEDAYSGIHKNITEGSWIAWRQWATGTELDRQISALGYLPALHPGEVETEPMVDPFERRQSVAVTLGRSYDTWALSELAKELGNETSLHIPYLYNYCGEPWKTQQRTRFLLDVWFKDNIFGTPGDDDGGAIAAWAVFTSMGFYPVIPGKPVYAITSPVFSEVVINLTNGRKFKVVAPGSTKRNKYIQSAELNGRPLDIPFITHEQIMAGGELTLELGEKPNRSWGITGIPPAF